MKYIRWWDDEKWVEFDNMGDFIYRKCMLLMWMGIKDGKMIIYSCNLSALTFQRQLDLLQMWTVWTRRFLELDLDWKVLEISTCFGIITTRDDQMLSASYKNELFLFLSPEFQLTFIITNNGFPIVHMLFFLF